jgi:hypothetical protein
VEIWRRAHAEYVTEQRAEDWQLAYHVRPVVVDLGGRRHTISAHEAQLLLAELGRLPSNRHGAADDTAASIMHAMAGGGAAALGDGERRVVLRALEGIRARHGSSPGLAALRRLLLDTLRQPVV